MTAQQTPFILRKASAKSGKKWSVRVPTSAGRSRKVRFGAQGYEDYTQHRDKARRSSYRARHAGDNINDPYSPGFWSWWVLWGDSTDIKRNFNAAVAKAKKLMKKRKNPTLNKMHPDMFEPSETAIGVTDEDLLDLLGIDDMDDFWASELGIAIEEAIEGPFDDALSSYMRELEEEDPSEDEAGYAMEALFEPDVDYRPEDYINLISRETDRNVFRDFMDMPGGEEALEEIIKESYHYEPSLNTVDDEGIERDWAAKYDWTFNAYMPDVLSLREGEWFAEEYPESTKVFEVLKEAPINLPEDILAEVEEIMVKQVNDRLCLDVKLGDVDFDAKEIKLGDDVYVENTATIYILYKIESIYEAMSDWIEENFYDEERDALEGRARALYETLQAHLEEFAEDHAEQSKKGAPGDLGALVAELPGGFVAYKLDTVESLHTEGERMRNCVGTPSMGYIRKLLAGERAFYSVRKANEHVEGDKPGFTVEVVVDGRGTPTKVKQIEGKGRRLPGFTHKEISKASFRPEEVEAVASFVQDYLELDPSVDAIDLRPGLNSLEGKRSNPGVKRSRGFHYPST